MARAPALLAAALALALSGAACTKTAANAPGVRFRQPSSLAVFRGITLGDATTVKPYFAVANQSRNDVSIVDAVTDSAVQAPLKLRTLVLPVDERPTLVAAASLGDDPAVGQAMPDVLVAVASGDSVLQLVETWNTANLVHSEPATDPLAVELGHDIRALVAVPSPAGTARIAAVLSDWRVAVVTYERQTDAAHSVAPVSPPVVSAPLPFQPEAIVAMPGDPALTSLFVATRDPIPDPLGAAAPVYGVAEISLASLAPVRALGARAPTRLVAAARLAERISGADAVTGDPLPGSAANDDAAFAGKAAVPRVYAVLDESGCGPGKPIDCGVVALDVSATVASGAEAIPRDRTPGSDSFGDQFMPYRPPMRVPARPLVIAASGPPAKPPPDVDGEPKWSTLPAAYMRIYSAHVARATTGVAAVACDDGYVYYLDLGRFETATASLAVATKPVSAAMPEYVRPAGCTSTSDAQRPECARRRLWLKTAPPPDGTFLADVLGVSDVVSMTPGWTPDQQWSLVYQGQISSALYGRAGEAGQDAGGTPWVALQASAGGGVFNQVARIWDPALGVREGDLLVVKARAVGCTGTSTGSSTDADNEFYVQVASLLPPDAASYPGGAVTVTHVATGDDPAWAACYAALVDRTSAGKTLTGLVVGFRAGAYVLSGVNTGVSGGVPLNLGYMGRPQPNVKFTLAYQDEDALASACPFEGWDGAPATAPLACDAACRETCEHLAVVRKLRRFQGVSVDCNTDPTLTPSCSGVWPGNKFPLVASPTALDFTFDLQRIAVCTATETQNCDPADPNDPTVGATPFRDLRLTILSKSNVTLNASIGKNTSPYQANGIVAFDRSAWTPDTVGGYRFLVSYPADFVLDATPGTTGADPGVIR
jgi:hypothetical protein